MSIRGASFGQTLVLVDGLRMNDAQTGHHNMDLPMPFQSIERIEVLHGSGSTMYGADALGGVVNFITAPPIASEVRAGSAFGNFGVNQQFGTASVVMKRWTEQVSFSRDFSTGFIPDRDYRTLTGSSETHLATGLGATTVLLAGGDKPFGADQFYGPYPSWERTKTWFAGASQELGANTLAQFGYRRHTDLFELIRDNPALYTNDHLTDSWQAAIRRHDALGKRLNVFYGVEGYRDTIDSNNFSSAGEAPALGQHARNRGGVYAAFDWRPLERLSFSVGAREEYYAPDGHGVFAPTVAGGYRISQRLKLRGSVEPGVSSADLHGPLLHRPDHDWQRRTATGNRMELRWWPRVERDATAGGLGDGLPAQREQRYRLRAGAGRNCIDGAAERNSAHLQLAGFSRSYRCIYQARNLNALSFTGVAAAARWQVNGANQVTFAYEALTGAEQALNGLLSKYLFNYPVNNASMQWLARLPGKFRCVRGWEWSSALTTIRTPCGTWR